MFIFPIKSENDFTIAHGHAIFKAELPCLCKVCGADSRTSAADHKAFGNQDAQGSGEDTTRKAAARTDFQIRHKITTIIC